MPSGPIGVGSDDAGEFGNAALVTVGLGGEELRTNLWLTSVSSDLNLEVNPAQLRRKVAFRPTRFQERFLNFVAVFTIRKLWKYDRVVNRIREHWAYNLNNDTVRPMRLIYPGANRSWKGFIERVQTGHDRFDVAIFRQFKMKLITSIVPHAIIIMDAPYIPSLGDVDELGDNWLGPNDLMPYIRNYEPTSGGA